MRVFQTQKGRTFRYLFGKKHGRTMTQASSVVRMVAALRTTDAEAYEMVDQLIKARGMCNTCALLGVTQLTLTAWTSRSYKPSAAAKKAIWLLWCLLLHPERIRTEFDIATWGRFAGCRNRKPVYDESTIEYHI